MTAAHAVSTEARIFVKQLTRDLTARERFGANILSPGTTCWQDAFHKFIDGLSETDSPTRAGRTFSAAAARLRTAQRQGACFVNASTNRSRSGFLEIMTYEVDTHPLTGAGYEGVVVRLYRCQLSRHGRIVLAYGDKVAFVSWHALARMHERSKIGIFGANGTVALCGFAGMLMRESRLHANSQINLTDSGMMCTGVLRFIPKTGGKKGDHGFFDVLTVLPLDDDRPALLKRIEQGDAIMRVVTDYYQSSEANPKGRVASIPVLPFSPTDYVSRELQRTKEGQGPDAESA